MVTRPRSPAREAEPAAPTARAKVNILVVDDDATKRFALRTVLAPLDENVVEASSGADALRQLLRNEFAVVLLDVRMPIMDGFETAQLIRQRPRSELTPLIFVTALDQAETDMGRGYNLGAVDFVFAPVVPAILRAKVIVFVELYRAQQELRRYRTQLETLVEERTIALTAINRELEAFSYSVSHDLRAPLVAFDGLSQTLMEKYGTALDARATDYLRQMRDASDRMTSVFDGLQMLFRLTSGEMKREEVDISDMAAQVVEEMRTANPDRQVNVDITPGVSASGDRRLVRILLTNLVNNAWKFTSAKETPIIAVGREVVDGESRIFVKDNGVGFDMIDSHRLFGAFQRLHSQSDFPGAGIGLATARRIVNRHGGRIWAEGAVGEGATFYFVL
ncbi:MAG: response regulator [Chloroflexi bacterium]|nr:MAG: response regulator [Chloroflexota bacterium]TMF73429.1 MAG: response regulator [Chloroflexota bacterium]TMF75999.1 MAG: response regulator [Chloroflexota bacterium]TMF93560.1 MAG: response regulator [Chloroflexota bacterium]TMG45410.1 MAG: response regulator [Chloroflexota bacterium]